MSSTQVNAHKQNRRESIWRTKNTLICSSRVALPGTNGECSTRWYSLTSTMPTSTMPTSTGPTSAEPTSAEPTSTEPTSAEPTSAEPTSDLPTSAAPTSTEPP